MREIYTFISRKAPDTLTSFLIHFIIWGGFLFLCSSCGQNDKKHQQTSSGNGSKALPQDMGNNHAPVITDLSALYTAADKTIRITYHVADPEEKEVSVALYYSADSGVSYQPFPGEVSGDAGTAVKANSSGTITAQFTGSIPGAGIRVALVADDKVPFPVGSFIERVDTAKLQKDITQLFGIRSHITDSVHKNLARRMIADSMAAYGYQVIRQHFMYTEYQGENIIARKAGYGKKNNKLIICAHYDTTAESPGADDNGSGIAGLLELVRLLSALPSEYTIELIAFDLEEAGMVGSSRYAALHDNSKEKIIGVLNMDMIGYMSTVKQSQKIPEALGLAFPGVKEKVAANDYKGDFVVCIANENSKELRDEYMDIMQRYIPQRKVISILTPGNSEVVPELRYSDHSSFWDKDYPAVFISDGSDSRNPNYHSPNDKLGTLNYYFMKDIVKAVLGFALEKSNTFHGSIVWKEVSMQ